MQTIWLSPLFRYPSRRGEIIVTDSINKKRRHSKIIAAIVIVVGIALIPAVYAYSQTRFPLTSYEISIDSTKTYDDHQLLSGDTMYGWLFVSGESVNIMVLDTKTFAYYAENNELSPDADPEVFLPGVIGPTTFQFVAPKADLYYLVVEPRCVFFCDPTSVNVVLQRSLGSFVGIPLVALYSIPAVMIPLGAVFLIYLSLRRK
ncbi:MAG: hypothetical protein V3U52_02350 [Thermoplasmata archaeon]